jgi:hydroxymethylpyrimidine pyrophosphatase-like HAD family hydrolase
MKFSVLALDYDGTIASDGVLDADVKAAIAEVRERGITVLLISGRIVSDLQQVAGNLDFVDVVVAENGAVLLFPNGHARVIGEPPDPVFLAELRRRSIDFAVGQCVVEADAALAPRILCVIHDLELPLVLVFNRSRLMVLPQAVSKGTGLRAALTALRLSAHNAIGIGDAENDHELLTACELGVAVNWGSEALKQRADEVLPGKGPRDVAAYLRQAAVNIRLPPDVMGRGQIKLGSEQDGSPVTLAIRGRNVLIVGDPRSGKSWGTGLFCEQLILERYCTCIIDPEGDYGELEALPGVVGFPPDQAPRPDELDRLLRHPDMSVILDLSQMPFEQKVGYVKSALPVLASLRRRNGFPHRIVVDEAHYFLHDPESAKLLDLELGAYALVTYRLSDVHPEVLKAMEVVVVNRTTDPDEVRALQKLAHASDDWTETFGSLNPGEASILPGGDALGQPRKFALLSRLTVHVRHRSKYLDVPVAPGRGFVFTVDGKPIHPPCMTLQEFVSGLESVPESALAEHARRGDFSRWIAEVFHDHPLASDLRKIEYRYRAGHVSKLRDEIHDAIEAHYEIGSDMVW